MHLDLTNLGTYTNNGVLEFNGTVSQLFKRAGKDVGGVRHMRSIGWDPIAVSGMVSLSPLAVKEAGALTGVTICKREELMNAQFAFELAAPFVAERAKSDRKAA